MTAITGEHNIASLAYAEQEMAANLSETADYLISSPRAVRFELPLRDGRIVVELSGSGNEPTWLWRALDQVKRFGALPANWDSYSAQPLQARAVRRWLHRVLPVLLAEDLPEPTVVLTMDGGLQLEWHRGETDVEIMIPPVGTIETLVVDPATGEREGSSMPDAVLPVLRRLAANPA